MPARTDGRAPADPAPDRAVLVLDEAQVHWTSDPRGPAALIELFHGERAAASWLTADGEPYARENLPVFRALADRTPVTGERVGHREPDGTTRRLLITALPVDWQGTPAVCVVVEDAAAVLASEREHRRLISAQAEAGMCSWDLHLDTGLVDTSGGEALWGLPPSDVPQPIETYLQRARAMDVPLIRRAIDATGEDGAQELTIGVDLPGGERRWLQLLIGRSDDSPRLLHGLTRDVTRRHEAEIAASRMEAQLAQAARLESLGQLAGGIAHDFNNLLGAIGIQVELAQRAVNRGETAAPYLHDIGEAVDRGVDLTRQLLAFSRLDEVHTQLVDVNAAAAQVRDLTRGLLPAGIHQRLETMPDLPPVVLPRGQLEQVLMNLVVNARDAMPDGGTLTLSTDVATDEETGHPWVHVAVTDSGTGMDQQTAARVFDPFFTTKPRGQGTGLGLAVVQGIVAKGGGRLRVDTAPGEGTRMTIALPAAIDVAEAERAAAARRPGRGQVVLVIEDDPALRAVIKAALDDAGFATVATDDPAVALDTVASSRVPVALSDVLMPGVSGPELAEQLRAIRPSLQVVLMSGYTDGRLATDEVTLRKPFTVAQLVAAVENALALADRSPPLG